MYAVIESTPGYLPDDDDPAVFDQFNEALNYLKILREELLASDLWLEIGNIEGDPPYKSLFYTDKRKTHDLGRIIEIVQVEN